jgi:glycosyltransferase involved in cell wall biosynthesis
MSIDSKISVIIPVYNLESCIERTLKSVCTQTYSNLEIIVVDDGSTDNSLDIINKCAESDNRIVPIHKDNGGVTSARLKGIELASGDWIGFVDGDDLIDEDLFEFLLSNAIKYDADISHCGYKMVFPNGKIDYYYDTGILIQQDNNQGITELLSGKFIEPGLWNKLYSKTLIDEFYKIGVMNVSIKNLEDLLMNYYLFKLANKSVYEDKCKYSYVLRENSAATSCFNVNKYYDPITVFETIMFDTNGKQKAVIYSRYISFLINHTLVNEKEIAFDANLRLKKNNAVITNKQISLKLKIMYILATYMNPIYKLIRNVYNRITKIDRKYDLA